MKVFEVLTDWHEEDGTIRQQREYVTAEDDDFTLVAAHYQDFCEQYEADLVRITDAVTVVQHIERPE